MANTPVGQQSPLDSVHKCERMHGRFAGQWERNTQHGFGVFVSAGGRERYVGEWRNGKKHGYGRWVTDDTYSAFLTLLSVRYPHRTLLQEANTGMTFFTGGRTHVHVPLMTLGRKIPTAPALLCLPAEP